MLHPHCYFPVGLSAFFSFFFSVVSNAVVSALSRCLPLLRPPHRSASKPTPTSRIRTKNLSRTPAIGKRVARAKNAVSQVSPENDNIAPGSDEEDAELDGGITSALMVSPTKAMPGMVAVTPSEDSEGTAEPPRPKKRAKRLFSA